MPTLLPTLHALHCFAGALCNGVVVAGDRPGSYVQALRGRLAVVRPSRLC